MSLLEGNMASTGDIWSTGAFSFESPLRDLLDSGTYTLEQLLGEDELLQELRGMHPQLIEFLSKEESVVGLVKYVGMQTQSQGTQLYNEGDSGGELEDDTLARIRFPYMACEIFCCEISSIINTLVEGQQTLNGENEEFDTPDQPKRTRPILDLLFSVLFTTPPGMLDDHQAGYLDKVVTVLFRKRPDAMSRYINNDEGNGGSKLMKVMFAHLHSHSIMQILQRLLLPNQSPMMQSEEDDSYLSGDDTGDQETWHDPSGTSTNEDNNGMAGLIRCNWSESPDAINMLVSSLVRGADRAESDDDEEKRLHEARNASEALITIIHNSPLSSHTLIELTTDPLLERLIKCAEGSKVGDKSDSDSSLFLRHDNEMTCAMNVLESIVLQVGGYGTTSQGDGGNLESDENSSAKRASPETLTYHLPHLLESLSQRLRHPSTQSWLNPTQYSPSVPQKQLGTSRLRIIRLLESLVLLGCPEVDSVLCQSDCLEVCLDLFWEFPWCSMLHQSVANLLVHIFEGANSRITLQKYFLVKCNLLGRLMDSFPTSSPSISNHGEEQNNLTNGGTQTSALPSSSLANAVMAMKTFQGGQASSSVESEQGSADSVNSENQGSVDGAEDIVRVSEHELDDKIDDQRDCVVNGNIRVAAERNGSRSSGDTSFHATSHAKAPGSMTSGSSIAQVGYTGHVIIICQALVHACTSYDSCSGQEVKDGIECGPVSPKMDGTEETNTNGIGLASVNSKDEGEHSKDGNGEKLNETTTTTNEVPGWDMSDKDLLLARLIDSHSLSQKWQQFISSRLASEIAIQTTPLGGASFSTGNIDNLQINQYDSTEDLELAGKGLATDEDLIDMDESELDLAASMMGALNLPAGQEREENGSGGHYMYDDPLGNSIDVLDKDETVGKEQQTDGQDADFDDPDESVPVMDLFAGNFNFGKEESAEQRSPTEAMVESGENWSDFANFDDAFTPFDSNDNSTASDKVATQETKNDSSTSTLSISPTNITEPTEEDSEADIFGRSSHTLLLD